MGNAIHRDFAVHFASLQRNRAECALLCETCHAYVYRTAIKKEDARCAIIIGRDAKLPVPRPYSVTCSRRSRYGHDS